VTQKTLQTVLFALERRRDAVETIIVESKLNHTKKLYCQELEEITTAIQEIEAELNTPQERREAGTQ
jgi:hypothetical protein